METDTWASAIMSSNGISTPSPSVRSATGKPCASTPFGKSECQHVGCASFPGCLVSLAGSSESTDRVNQLINRLVNPSVAEILLEFSFFRNVVVDNLKPLPSGGLKAAPSQASSSRTET